MEPVQPDPEVLRALVRARMPFGRYKGTLLIDLPEPYVVWFAQQGFPKGKLGDALRMVYEIKLNGLEGLLTPLRDRDGKAAEEERSIRRRTSPRGRQDAT